MNENKTKPTNVYVEEFLETVSEARRSESHVLMGLMQEISGEQPCMWGPSIIGFGTQHYRYDTGREGDTPLLGFSPRKSAITLYFNEGFDRYAAELTRLGKHTSSVSCLYVNKLADIDVDVLRSMLQQSFEVAMASKNPPVSVEDYVASVPAAARPQFDALRVLVKSLLPSAEEVLSYGIVGYRKLGKRPFVFISAWKDHLAVYPIPKDAELEKELAPHAKGKGTLWFSLDKPLPKELIKKLVKAHVHAFDARERVK